jgi:hypothetical protein
MIVYPNGRERALAIKDNHDGRSAADGDRSSGSGNRACCELIRVTSVDSQPLTAAERMRRSRARRRGDPTLLRQGAVTLLLSVLRRICWVASKALAGGRSRAGVAVQVRVALLVQPGISKVLAS